MAKSKFLTQGFTLFEVLVTISVLAVLSAAGVGYYRNFVRNVEFDSVAKGIIFDLKNAQSKAMAGEDDVKWGIHFVNGSEDYYELFSTPTSYSDTLAIVKTTVYLPGAIAFSTPAEGVAADIIFDKITGAPSNSTVTIFFEGESKTITATAAGNIY